MNDRWALNNTAYSLAYMKREDIPLHFAIAEAYTVGDMYQVGVLSIVQVRLWLTCISKQSAISPTDSNRVYWNSGSINIPGGPQTPDE